MTSLFSPLQDSHTRSWSTSKMGSVEVGQLYIDKMFRAEMKVTKANDKGVWLKDTAPSANLRTSEYGSLYVWDSWRGGIQANRFKRVDRFLNGDDDTDITDSEPEPEPEQEEPEEPENGEERPKQELTSDSFGDQGPLTW